MKENVFYSLAARTAGPSTCKCNFIPTIIIDKKSNIENDMLLRLNFVGAGIDGPLKVMMIATELIKLKIKARKKKKKCFHVHVGELHPNK